MDTNGMTAEKCLKSLENSQWALPGGILGLQQCKALPYDNLQPEIHGRAFEQRLCREADAAAVACP